MTKYSSVTDWNDAYANRDHVPEAMEILDQLEIDAPAFRRAWAAGGGRVLLEQPYGSDLRETYDLFSPQGNSKGLFIFVHGGYWMAFDKNSWSHLARQALERGWSVGIISYSLCPEVKIGDITKQVGNSVEKIAQKVAGPIVLAGHSAGGHLVSRMACENAPLNNSTTERISKIIAISGVNDLRPLLNLELNCTLNLDMAQAIAESPAFLAPRAGTVIDCVVGGSERPEFVRQNALLANIWVGLGAKTREITVENKHHFNIIDELSDGAQGWFSLE